MEILQKFKRLTANPGRYTDHYGQILKRRYSAAREARKQKKRLTKLKKIKNTHRGERCVIIGMGPSLKVADLDRFKGIYTIACNKIYLAYEETDWRPDYYMVSDVLVAENNKEAIASVKAQKYFPDWVEHRCPELAKINWIPCAKSPEYMAGKSVGFAQDLTEGIQPGGATVIYDMLQLAFHLGFSEVALVGIDFSFENSAASGDKCEQGEVLVSAGEVNHFAKDYRKPGETWTVPKMDEQRIAFAKAAEVFAANGRLLVNASRNTKLEEVERVDFDGYFPEFTA